MVKRPVIVHFHLFKNAGTSVDRILQQNFSNDEWAEVEGPDRRKLDPEQLIDFIRDNPKLKAVSSHTAVVSIPKFEDIEYVPILFMRHPIDRIRSAFDFEKKQDADTPGAKFARKSTFEEYMEWRLTQPTKAQVSNFHAMRLKDFHEYTPFHQTELILPRAKAAIDALPVVGVVDMFDKSMERFAALIGEHFPDFKISNTRVNTTSPVDHSLEENVMAFKRRIGAKVFQKLKAHNEIDFEIFRYAKARMRRLKNQTIA